MLKIESLIVKLILFKNNEFEINIDFLIWGN